MEINFKFNLNGRLPLKFLSFYGWYLNYEKSNASKITKSDEPFSIFAKLIFHFLGKSAALFIKFYAWILHDILKKDIKFWKSVKKGMDGVEIKVDYGKNGTLKKLISVLRELNQNQELKFRNFNLIGFSLVYGILALILSVALGVFLYSPTDENTRIYGPLIASALVALYVLIFILTFIFYQLRFVYLLISKLIKK